MKTIKSLPEGYYINPEEMLYHDEEGNNICPDGNQFHCEGYVTVWHNHIPQWRLLHCETIKGDYVIIEGRRYYVTETGGKE